MRHRRPAHLPRLPGPTDGLSIGIMGGSFDPPHAGHTHVIETARKRLGLDWVWVIPAAGNPLKRTTTPFADRMAAAQNRFSSPRVRVSPIEAELGSPYTFDLIRSLKRRAPGARFVLIIGSDNLAGFHRWRRWRELARMLPVAVVSRPGGTHAVSRFAATFPRARVSEGEALTLSERQAPAWIYLHAPLDQSSSTALRALMLQVALPPV